MIELTSAQRRALRAQAHALHPVVTIAANGLSPAVLTEIGRALDAHELIKIKVHGVERKARDLLLLEICHTLNAAPVQHIGTILVVWRERPADVAAPAAAAAAVDNPRRPTHGKSVGALAAKARQSAHIQASAEKKRGPANRVRRSKPAYPGSGTR